MFRIAAATAAIGLLETVTFPAIAESRPACSVLKLSETDILARFTPEVRKGRHLVRHALTLWQAKYEERAQDLRRRFVTESDWRPSYADAAMLVDDFLEESNLPRQRRWRANTGRDWVEVLDPKTGRRARKLVPAYPSRDRLIAPVPAKSNGDGKQPDVRVPVKAPK